MDPAGKPARILIVDDHPLIREGLTARISHQPGLVICGEAEDVSGALKCLRNQRPDVMIVDIALREGNGLDLVKQARALDPELRMLVVSAYDETLYAERALRAGALGYVSKQECCEKLIDAIRTILKGQRYISPAVSERLVGLAIYGRGAGSGSPVENLTDRELEVFQLIGRGLRTGEIARQLHLSSHTIDSHREKLKLKLNLTSGTELNARAVAWVLEHG